MLHRFRTGARWLAAALLVSLATLGASSIVPHADDCHGDACLVPAAPHDPSSHRAQSASPEDEHGLHCVVCHWSRLHRPSAEPSTHLAPDVEDRQRPLVEPVAIATANAAAQPPLRSPPHAPTLV
jgi:hypothetical protein